MSFGQANSFQHSPLRPNGLEDKHLAQGTLAGELVPWKRVSHSRSERAVPKMS